MNRTEFLKYICDSINSDLKFAETKNTFLTTFNLAMVGTVISFVFDSDKNFGSDAVRNCFIAFLIVILISTFLAIFSFLPLNSFWKILKPKIKGEENFFFYYSNFSKHKNDYDTFAKTVVQNIDKCDLSDTERQLTKQILDLSRVAYTKYSVFSIALTIELFAFPILILGLLL